MFRQFSAIFQQSFRRSNIALNCLFERRDEEGRKSESESHPNEGVVQVPLATRVSRPSSLQSPKRASILSSHPLTMYKGVYSSSWSIRTWRPEHAFSPFWLFARLTASPSLCNFINVGVPKVAAKSKPQNGEILRSGKEDEALYNSFDTITINNKNCSRSFLICTFNESCMRR